MGEVNVGILGLGRLGASIGLALKRYNGRPQARHQFKVTGYSGRSDQVKTAQSLGAVDTISNQPHDAVRGRDIVVLAMPYAEVEATYQYIAADLRAGVVVLDFSTLKQKPMGWSSKHLGADVHMVGMTPILNPRYLFDGVDQTERATADLFDDGVIQVMPNVKSIPEALELATDFSALLGARALFTDPAEHDSLLTMTDTLPRLLGLAYYTALTRGTGWDDVQRSTNPAFGMLTYPLFDTHPDDLAGAMRDGKDDLVRALDSVMQVMRELRTAISTDDRTTLESASADAAESYEAWYNKRRLQKFDDAKVNHPDSPGIMTSLFGSILGGRLSGRGKNNDKEGK